MLSNEDAVEAILNKMETQNQTSSMIQALQILAKLAANIVQNPFEPKYRHVKISNSIIKTKLMVLSKIDQLLKQLGYSKENQDLYTLKDEEIGDFLEGSPAIEYKLRLLQARQRSQADYEKELLLIQVHKEQRAEEAKRREEARKLKEKCEYDKQQRKYMHADQSKSNDLKFGTKTTTWKDIGVDLCAKKGQ